MIDEFTQSGKRIYKDLQEAAKNQKKCFAILFDPEEHSKDTLIQQVLHLPEFTTHILVGGSTATQTQTQLTVQILKKNTDLPVILFPGDYKQISKAADGILFLTLLSGENPEYLIRQQIKSVKQLQHSGLEIIPTGYILIDGGIKTAVERVSHTQALPHHDVERVVSTALAGEYSGKKLIYLEAGSGALKSVSTEIIQAVKSAISIPLIVGGGIRTPLKLQQAYEAGADLVVVGTAFEKGEF
ncbi:geranylgeranylglyceryl/heptaprenylglyceryl phosphate synthase [Leeuwenhoekiella polynyae]|uniref:Geranylgeranylglyceryl phosphate synthase n=1 Tax=Leeuwenhoekiella polynyae TaxID=1550906 RepID=A0A4Q0P2C4_9FLAO|nr:geranylgeranylglyceryl/heptaprenylglyceryl phosphate synthase [Leeuwenhoekiella polynyae]RXG20637.1 putative glycerol-1-phosphate prenyltransferase [Leeuwenhoekiella polynyae]